MSDKDTKSVERVAEALTEKYKLRTPTGKEWEKLARKTRAKLFKKRFK